MTSVTEMVGERTRIITVAGHIGSGKSAVCAEITKQTGWPLLSTGAIFRSIAARHGMSVLELNQYAETHPEVDEEVDAYLRDLAKSSDPIVVDSRMAWYFIPLSFKVYLVVDPQIAAARVYKATRPDERYMSMGAASTNSSERQRVEGERYRNTYAVESGNWRNYDIIVDTSDASPQEIASLILGRVLESSPDTERPECWLSPRRLIPTLDGGELGIKTESVHDSCLEIAVHEGSFFIVGGHAQVSAALQQGDLFIKARLVAFEEDEVFPGLSE